MFEIHQRKLLKYKNISNDIKTQKIAYLFDLELKSVIFPYLEKLEDSFKNYLSKEIWDRFLDYNIFNEKYLQTRILLNEEKITQLNKRYDNINFDVFFLNLTFGEAVRYFRDLKMENKENIVKNFYFKKVEIFENWIYSMRYFRNLLCHGENIFNRKFKDKIKWKVLLKAGLDNNIFFSYLIVLEVFNCILWWKLIYKKFSNISKNIENNQDNWLYTLNTVINSILIKQFYEQKNSPVWDHISKLEIEGWWVLIEKVYWEFIKNQVFFQEDWMILENKQIFKENELEELKQIIEKEKKDWKTIVWTNGCFDIMHPGHMKTFEIAKKIWWENTIVIVWMNWKNSPYWQTKPWRPINNEEFRSKMLASLKNVDYIYIFDDKTPARPVNDLKPDYVLKWWDYYIKEISKNKFKWISKDKLEKINIFNKIIEKELISKKNWIIDITWIYKYILENNLENIACKVKWFMSEWLVNVQNWWKVILVPIEWNFSTTSIVEKIKSL